MAGGGRGNGRGRVEPRFDDAPGKRRPADLRATRDDDYDDGDEDGSAPRDQDEFDEPGSARSRKAVRQDREPQSRKKSSKSDTRAQNSRTTARESWRFQKKRRSIGGILLYWLLLLGLWGGIAVAGIVVYYGAQLPPIDQLAIPKRPPNIAIMAEDGSLIVNRGDSGGPAIRLGELPVYLPKAFVAIEDRRFYHHFGIDPLGISRAVLHNVTGRGGAQGGSTLTQQLAKNLFLTQERTLSRKVQEAILAVWLEHKYSKDQILELYLNRVYFGSGAYGVEAASRKYFAKSARSVTLSEAATLAGLMKAPTKLAPNRNPEGAAERAGQVITAMAKEGYITEAMAQLALSRPARAVREEGAGTINYVADYVMDTLDDTVGAIDDDIVVSTTLVPAMQVAAEKALIDELDLKGSKFGVSQGALVSMDANGGIKALVGGRNYADSQFNRAVSAKRQPGSSFKPFVYLAALEHGLTPDTIREDGPLSVKGWQPENYSHEYFGNVSLTKALSLSLNTVAVRLGQEVSPKIVVKTAHRLGIQSELQPNASLPLGTSEVSPLELVTAYAPFANGGIGVQSHIINKVRTTDGKVLYLRKGANFGRVIDPQYVAMMNTMMQETLLTGTARKAELPGWQAAGKTGTSQDYRDAWFVGYTSALITGVWLGNDDATPTKKTSGGNLPVEIWSRYMKTALAGTPSAPLPGGIWHGNGLDALTPPEPQNSTTPFNGPPTQPLPTAGPLTINRAGEANIPPQTFPVKDKPTVSSLRKPAVPDTAELIPPADVPNSAPRPQKLPVSKQAPISKQDKSLFEKLFGG